METSGVKKLFLQFHESQTTKFCSVCDFLQKVKKKKKKLQRGNSTSCQISGH